MVSLQVTVQSQSAQAMVFQTLQMVLVIKVITMTTTPMITMTILGQTVLTILSRRNRSLVSNMAFQQGTPWVRVLTCPMMTKAMILQMKVEPTLINRRTEMTLRQRPQASNTDSLMGTH